MEDVYETATLSSALLPLLIHFHVMQIILDRFCNGKHY